METRIVEKNNIKIAVIYSEDVIIKDVQSALDFMATVDYETGCSRILIFKSAVCEDFFDLKTKIAGDILQKFINYQKKIAIVGDFTIYSSKSLRDFIYECNKGKDIFFLQDTQVAITKLSEAI
ncbi:MAG: DUF4180 domain-containing protein [Clostridia bacterium]|jgi:hypothetical protein